MKQILNKKKLNKVEKLGLLLYNLSEQEDLDFGDTLTLSDSSSGSWVPLFERWLEDNKPEFIQRLRTLDSYEGDLTNCLMFDPSLEDISGYESELLLSWAQWINENPIAWENVRDQVCDYLNSIEDLDWDSNYGIESQTLALTWAKELWSEYEW